MTYEDYYFENYQKLDETEMGKRLTSARVDFVRKHTSITPVDIGIGAGAFVKACDCFGYDVNQKAVEWLKSEGRYEDPYEVWSYVITCWDSLEHIPEPEKLINSVTDYVFVSIPIFENGAHVLKSKHFKPGEHLYYFTNNGLIDWFDKLGFDCIDSNTMESDLGREGIYTYAFRRR